MKCYLRFAEHLLQCGGRRKAEQSTAGTYFVPPESSSIPSSLRLPAPAMAITLSEDSSIDNIYTGFWVNQAYGPFRGACLTLSQEAGGLLIAFLALFVTAASSSIWKITRFMLHTTYATPKVHLQDGLHQQRQILLRNTALPINTALSMLWASKVWRNRAANPRKRTIPVAALALAVSAIFAAASEHNL